MKSIIQLPKRCYVCHTTQNLHLHHIIYGNGNRSKSDQYGLTVWLCARHHDMSNEGVHCGNKELDLELKKLAQSTFEKKYHRSFLDVFGKNYM